MRTHKLLRLVPLTNLFFALLVPLLAGILVAENSSANAQNKSDKLDALHTSYITEKLNLTDAEAQKFWPVYDDYQKDKGDLRKQKQDEKQTVKNAGGFDKMSDKDVQKWIVEETDIRSRELDLEKQYLAKFEGVLPLRKVAKFYVAEDEFKIYLLKQLMNRQNGPPRRERQFVPQ